MTAFKFDADGLRAMETSVSTGRRRTMTNLRKATEVTLRNVKDDAGKNVKAIAPRRLRHLARGFKYDIEKGPTKVEGRVAAYGGKQVRLIGIIENGSPTSRAWKPLKRALAANVNDFMRGVDKALEDSFD